MLVNREEVEGSERELRPEQIGFNRARARSSIVDSWFIGRSEEYPSLWYAICMIGMRLIYNRSKKLLSDKCAPAQALEGRRVSCVKDWSRYH